MQNYRCIISDPGQQMIHKETKEASDSPRENIEGRPRERTEEACISFFLAN